MAWHSHSLYAVPVHAEHWAVSETGAPESFERHPGTEDLHRMPVLWAPLGAPHGAAGSSTCSSKQ